MSEDKSTRMEQDGKLLRFIRSYYDGHALNPDVFCREQGDLDGKLREQIDDFLRADRVLGPSLSAAQPQSIAGYKILSILGEGGMGVVYLAEQVNPVRRKVAIKLVKPGMDNRTIVRRFEAERQALALMSHPSIAKLFEAGTSGSGQPYFVMEHVPGVPIVDYCEKRMPLVKDRIRLLMKVCDAVQHAHSKGVVHRDLKPSNILVVEDGGGPFPVIIDFGIAKAIKAGASLLGSPTTCGSIVGTPSYMSPEQKSGKEIDERSDVFSLGVVLQDVVVGPAVSRLPGPKRKGQFWVKTAAIRRSSESHPTISEVRRIVRKCLSTERAGRYSTVAALRKDLVRCLHRLPVRFDGALVTSRARAVLSPHMSRSAMIVLAAVVAVAVAILSIAMIEQEKSVAAEKSKKHYELALSSSSPLARFLHAAKSVDILDSPESRGLLIKFFPQRPEEIITLDYSYGHCELDPSCSRVLNVHGDYLEEYRISPNVLVGRFGNVSSQERDFYGTALYSDDGEYIVAGTDSGRIQVWASRSHTLVADKSYVEAIGLGEEEFTALKLLAVDPVGEFLVFGSEFSSILGVASFPDLESARFLDLNIYPSCLGISSDGKDLFVVEDSGFLLVLERPFLEYQEYDLGPLPRFESITNISMSEIDRTVVMSHLGNEIVRAVDIDTGRVFAEVALRANVIPHRDQTDDVVATTSTGNIVFLDRRNLDLRRVVHAHDGYIKATQWIDEERLLATMGNHIVQLWRGSPFREDPKLREITVNASGGLLAGITAAGDAIVILDSSTGQTIAEIDLSRYEGNFFERLFFAQDGSLLLLSGGSCHSWPLSGDPNELEVGEHRIVCLSETFWVSRAVAQRVPLVALGNEAGFLQIIDVEVGLSKEIDLTGVPLGVAFDSSEEFVFTALSDGEILEVALGSGAIRRLAKIEEDDAILAFDLDSLFSCGDQLAVVCHDVRFAIDRNTGVVSRRRKGMELSGAQAKAGAPGPLVVRPGMYKEISIVHRDSWREVARFQPYEGPVDDYAVAPGGGVFFTASVHEGIRRWDLAPLKWEAGTCVEEASDFTILQLHEDGVKVQERFQKRTISVGRSGIRIVPVSAGE